MEAELKKTEKPVLEKVAERLVAAQQELDKLAVQFALGKAEAKDKFEEVKKELQTRVNELKHTFMTKALNELITTLKTKVEELEVQLALGKAETAEIFEEQSKKILQSVNSLEHEIRSKLPDHQETHVFSQDVEKFKLKIEILRLKFILKKFEMTDAFRDKMDDARHAINTLKHSVKNKMESGKHSYQDFKDEMQLTYKHLRQAVESINKD